MDSLIIVCMVKMYKIGNHLFSLSLDFYESS